MPALHTSAAGGGWFPDPRPTLMPHRPPMTAHPPHSPVLPRVAAGDTAAVRVCLERYGRLVLGMARRWLGSDSDAEDATQEVFIDLWKQAGRYDPRVASELTFVAMIARRKLIDRLRRQKSRPPAAALGEDPISPQNASVWELNDELAPVREALDELPPAQRQVLLLAVSDGATHPEIAELTGLPLGTVKTHIRRGLLYVRERLATRTRGGAK